MDLQDSLDQDLAWRRKELIEIKFLIDNSVGSTLQINLRMGVALLYAHWEGYIKNSAVNYLIYLSNFNFKYNELTENFVALSLRGNIKTCANTDKVSLHYSVVNTLINELNSETKIPHTDVIPKVGMLKYDLLAEILFTLGLEKTDFELKQNLIDKDLIERRNYVVHGLNTSVRKDAIKKDDFNQLYCEVVPMLEKFQDLIYKAAQNRTYKKILNVS
ncbi:MAG: MAE_28990/MAE_18760 family HEPN-like nuclease [Methanoregula sp.]|uniref:MAE_28990/MAE_18760 family HEPN-like nuclease n=1 Tax=Methanoregula sp. TaxID=2052170 RepID=UPI003D13929E